MNAKFSICGLSLIKLVKLNYRIAEMGGLTPMNTFLRQELDRMQRVLKTVRSTLTDLKLAIDGTIIMNEVRNTKKNYDYLHLKY